MIYKGKGGIQYTLSAKPLAAGGEGEIYDITGKPNAVAKIYKPGKTSVEKERKLIKMVSFPPDNSVLSQIAWPQDVLYDSGKFVGFVMPKMSINEDLNVIYEYGAAAKYPHMPWESRLVIAQNLCVVLSCVHAVGHTVGDFNPKNISVNPKTGHIMFLDTDSYHIADGSDTLRCDVGMPEYLPAEIQFKMRGGGTLATAKLPTFTQDTDNFALAIHIFQLLMNGVHPFACAIIPSQSSVTAPQPHENISKGEFPFMQNIPGVKIPVYAPKISILPKEIQALFERAFIDGYVNPGARPSAEEWHKAIGRLRGQLKTCSNVQHHQYYKALSDCPWCDVNNTFSQSFQPKSTLTQQTIKAPQYTPPPSRPAQANSSYTSSTTSTSSYRTPAKKRMSAGAKVAIFAFVIGAGALLTGMVSGWFDFGNGINSGSPSPAPAAAPLVTATRVGDNITFGEYDWRVLDVQGDRKLLLSEHVLFEMGYHDTWQAVTWEHSSLRRYLNNEFLGRFSAEERARIAEVRNVNNDNPWFGASGGNDTNDRIFLLSLEEVVRYFGDSGQLGRPEDAFWIYDEFNHSRIGRGTDNNTRTWWLRSPGQALINYVEDFAATVHDSGLVDVHGLPVVFVGGIRPALWLNLE